MLLYIFLTNTSFFIHLLFCFVFYVNKKFHLHALCTRIAAPISNKFVCGFHFYCFSISIRFSMVSSYNIRFVRNLHRLEVDLYILWNVYQINNSSSSSSNTRRSVLLTHTYTHTHTTTKRRKFALVVFINVYASGWL